MAWQPSLIHLMIP